jgi:pimeloyl-ACP methyl ester carboxylesterase
MWPLDVDPSRIGLIGHSYGGRMAIRASAFDERIRAAVSNCGCVNYRNSLTRDAGIQMAFCIPGILTLGDLEDVLRLAAPCALLIQAAEGDKWSRGAQVMFDHARVGVPRRSVRNQDLPGRPSLLTEYARDGLCVSRPSSDHRSWDIVRTSARGRKPILGDGYYPVWRVTVAPFDHPEIRRKPNYPV